MRYAVKHIIHCQHVSACAVYYECVLSTIEMFCSSLNMFLFHYPHVLLAINHIFSIPQEVLLTINIHYFPFKTVLSAIFS